jgi:hypothetical protein
MRRLWIVQVALAAVAQTASTEPPPETTPAPTTVNVVLDAYFNNNFNSPVTGKNLLRAYDLTSNGFGLNQASLVVERPVDVNAGRRFGVRLDLMAGQATDTLQGSPVNEPRPEAYRHIFQAYGTYAAPLGKGATVDFGKWASQLGIEGNYTKDQFNYSRSYWFSFLPYYHMGARVTYPVMSKLNASYWLINGANQTEDFNTYKSQTVLLSGAPASGLTANLVYYAGREQPAADGRAPRGRTHFVDGYLTWELSSRWTFAAEGDYAVMRVEPWSPPQRVTGGAGYVRHRLTSRFSLAGRYVRLNDANGWFSGARQSFNDVTATATLEPAPGVQVRWEVRRDWSNLPYFPGESDGVLRRGQITALMGLVWWYGGKTGAW